MTEPRPVAIAGIYETPEALKEAARQVSYHHCKVWDCHTPHPVHGLDRDMGLRPSPLGIIAMGAGFGGAVFAMAMQWWMSAVDYPVRTGGKPFFSWPAFVPVAFELFVLFAALAITGGVILFCRLGRWHTPLADAGVLEEATTSRFVIVIGTAEGETDPARAKEILRETGCTDIRPVLDEEEKP